MKAQFTLDLTPPQLQRPMAALKAAKRAGDKAISAGEAKARKVDPAFVDKACLHIVSYLATWGKSSGELLTDSCKQAGIRPTDDRHFGCVSKALLKRGWVRCVGSCPRIKGHGSAGAKLYELGPKAP